MIREKPPQPGLPMGEGLWRFRSILRLNGQPEPMSEAFLQMVGVFSQLELFMIRMRVRSGMANARAKGKRIGRPQVTVEDLPSVF